MHCSCLVNLVMWEGNLKVIHGCTHQPMFLFPSIYLLLHAILMCLSRQTLCSFSFIMSIFKPYVYIFSVCKILLYLSCFHGNKLTEFPCWPFIIIFPKHPLAVSLKSKAMNFVYCQDKTIDAVATKCCIPYPEFGSS